MDLGCTSCHQLAQPQTRHQSMNKCRYAAVVLPRRSINQKVVQNCQSHRCKPFLFGSPISRMRALLTPHALSATEQAYNLTRKRERMHADIVPKKPQNCKFNNLRARAQQIVSRPPLLPGRKLQYQCFERTRLTLFTSSVKRARRLGWSVGGLGCQVRMYGGMTAARDRSRS